MLTAMMVSEVPNDISVVVSDTNRGTRQNLIRPITRHMTGTKKR